VVGRNGAESNGAVGRNGAGDRDPGSPLANEAVTSTAWLPVGGLGAPGAVHDGSADRGRSADERAGLGDRTRSTTAKPPARGRATHARAKDPADAEIGDQVERPVGNGVRQSPSGRAGHRSDGDVARRAGDRTVPTANEHVGRAAPARDKTTDQAPDGEQDASERDRARASEAEEIRRCNLDRPVSELTFAELIDGALAAYREG
jgi:hypothetical protein